MKSFTIAASVLVVAFVSGLLGFVSIRVPSHAEAGDAANVWSMTSTELLAEQGVTSRLAEIGIVFRPDGRPTLNPSGEIARVASGDQSAVNAILKIAGDLRGVDLAREELAREAQRARGLSVAIVESGATWVPKH